MSHTNHSAKDFFATCVILFDNITNLKKKLI